VTAATNTTSIHPMATYTVRKKKGEKGEKENIRGRLGTFTHPTIKMIERKEEKGGSDPHHSLNPLPCRGKKERKKEGGRRNLSIRCSGKKKKKEEERKPPRVFAPFHDGKHLRKKKKGGGGKVRVQCHSMCRRIYPIYGKN